MADKRIPVTILTGFLGSGKTTLLNHILTEKHGQKIAVIENEFGAIGVDEHLLDKRAGGVINTDEEIIEVLNGCICCTVRADLSVALKKIVIQKAYKLDAIIIETTGLADPAPVAQTFFVDEEIAKKCRLDGIVTVVDAKNIMLHLDEQKPEGVENESVEQIAFADRIILNKTDLVTEEELKVIKARITSINLSAEIMPTNFSKVDPNRLLNIKAFELNSILKAEPDFLDTEKKHQHDDSVKSISFRWSEPVILAKMEEWLTGIVKNMSNDLFRYKGIVHVKGMKQRFVWQGVHMLNSGNFTENWKKGEKRESIFVFIGRNLDKEAIMESFTACKAADLRFSVGARVEVNVGTFVHGKVLKHWDEGNAYRVRLLNATGEDVWAPVDEDDYIRQP